MPCDVMMIKGMEMPCCLAENLNAALAWYCVLSVDPYVKEGSLTLHGW